MHRPALLAVALLAATAATASLTTASTASTTASIPPHPCTFGATPVKYDHVVVLWLENRSYSAVAGSPSWQRVNTLASRCASAVAWSGASHPSLPNYLAAASGATGGVSSDCGPASCPQDRPSIYGTLTAAGLKWRTYAGGITRPGCYLSSQGRYAPKHVAATYFADARAACATSVVPLTQLAKDAAANKLPSYAEVVPDLCDDGHDCSSSHADEVAGNVIRTIVTSPAWPAGRTALIVTFDEGSGGYGGQRCSASIASCHVVFVAAARSVRPGTIARHRATHADLARLTEDLLGIAHLTTTAHRASLRPSFGL